MDETIPMALVVLLVHLTMATAFANIRWMKFWMLRAYGEIANLCYERYLLKGSDPSVPQKEIDRARKLSHEQLSTSDGLFLSFEALTRKNRLYLGSWIPYLFFCLLGSFSVSMARRDVQKIRLDRLRREKLRA